MNKQYGSLTRSRGLLTQRARGRRRRDGRYARTRARGRRREDFVTSNESFRRRDTRGTHPGTLLVFFLSFDFESVERTHRHATEEDDVDDEEEGDRGEENDGDEEKGDAG